MRIHHLNCGTMRPFGRRLVNGTGNPFSSGELVCHCLLIETEQGLVLVDSGVGLEDVERPAESLGRWFQAVARPVLNPDETAVRQVAALGYDIEDVRHIVLTHLDLDHAGGLRDFPRATVHVLKAELDAALSAGTSAERLRYPAVQRAHGPNWQTYEPVGEPWFGFDSVRNLVGLPPEILLVPLAGHTRGHTGVAVDSGHGWLLHAGDAYFFHGEVDPANTRTVPGLRLFQSLADTERSTRLHNQHKLLELARTSGAEVTIFSAHDPMELRRHQKATPPVAT
jgi:glyoxylase-like metal-dependent hydrolase (beta-lactamase superfamily II)